MCDTPPPGATHKRSPSLGATSGAMSGATHKCTPSLGATSGAKHLDSFVVLRVLCPLRS